MRDHNSQRDSRDNGIQSNDYVEFCKDTDVLPYLLAILEDCKNMNPLYGRTDYLRDCKTMSRRYTHEGLSFATKTLPNLFDNLLRYLETGNSAYPSFRILKGRNYPVFLQQLFKPIYEDHTSEYAVLCIKLLYQLCVAFKKLKGPYKKSVLTKQLCEFLETDENLNFDLSALDEHTLLVVYKARSIVRQVTNDLNPFDVNQAERFIPRPGPGATNTPVEKFMRYRPHKFDAQLEAFGYSEWYNPPLYPPRGKRPWDLRVGSARSSALPERNLLTSRFKFVHKTFGKARGICIEELEMQWLQQGVRRALYDRIEQHPLTKGFVSFTDQSINGLKALQASEKLDMCTIDMSSASDRISRKLVEYLFQDNPELLKALLDLSTRYVQLPEELATNRKFFHMRKYAPMGSALCFPVMGLVHFALIKAILSNTAPQHINDIPVFVYGDDILVETQYTEEVMKVLPLFGMKINEEKSFYKSLFRESCGVHAYNGVDITPVRFKEIVRNHSSVNDLVGLLKQEAELYKRGFLSTAKLIRLEFLKVPHIKAHKFPYVGPKSAILGWIRGKFDASYALARQGVPRRWDSQLQCFHYKLRTVVDIFDNKPPEMSEKEFYLRKLVENPEPWQTRKMNGVSKGLTVRWKWHADSALGFHNDLQWKS